MDCKKKDDYTEIFNRAKKRWENFPYKKYILAGGAVVIAAVFLAVLAGSMGGASKQGGEPAAAQADSGENTPRTTMSEEEIAAKKEAEEKQAVVDSYENLGLVQVSGYLNVREAPGPGGKIIGKLQEKIGELCVGQREMHLLEHIEIHQFIERHRFG